MEGDVITLQDIFLFDYGMGVDEDGRFRGHLKATGVRPKFAEKLADLGIRLGPEVFQPEAFARQGIESLMRKSFRFRDLRFAALVVLVISLFASFTGAARADDDQRLVIRSVDALEVPRDAGRRAAGRPRAVAGELQGGGERRGRLGRPEQPRSPMRTSASASSTPSTPARRWAKKRRWTRSRPRSPTLCRSARRTSRSRSSASASRARVVSNFTTDTGTLDNAIATLRPSLERPESVERDGMRTALSLLDDTSLQGNIVVFQAGGNDVSVSTEGEVEGDLLDSDVMVVRCRSRHRRALQRRPAVAGVSDPWHLQPARRHGQGRRHGCSGRRHHQCPGAALLHG